MNRIFKLMPALLVCLLCFSCSDNAFPVWIPVEGETPVHEEEVDFENIDVSGLTADNHPRLIFTDADFDAIRMGSSGQVFLSIHNQIIAKANTFIGASELKRVLSGKRLLDVSRKALERLSFCAYAYKTTGEAKYLAQAETDLVSVCNFSDWNAAQHFLDVGEMAAGVALAYDWLYAELKDETKELAVEAIKKFAFKPADERVWNLNFYTAQNNWNQVCNGGLIAAALATYESNSVWSSRIIRNGLKSNIKAVESMYSPDGNYPEGYSYWCYGTIYQVLINAVLETATGNDRTLSSVDGFSKTGKYMLFMEGCLNMCYNYSDSTPSVVPALAQWYFAYKFDDTSVLYIEKSRLDKYRSAAESRLLPLVAYYAYKLDLSSLDEIKAPAENIWSGAGVTPVVLVHDTWSMDANDRFLGIKGGQANTSHGHMDAGSFVYEAYGVRWADDLTRPSYGAIEAQVDYLWDMMDGSGRWTIKQYNNMHHNTLTVNGKYHLVGGAASVVDLIDNADKKGGIVDITAALGGEVASARRSVYLYGEDMVVMDEITAKADKDAAVSWALVSRCTPSKYGATIKLAGSNGRNMYLHKSSDTGHNPTWFVDDGKVTDPLGGNTGAYRCGYTVNIKKGESATILVRFSPKYN